MNRGNIRRLLNATACVVLLTLAVPAGRADQPAGPAPAHVMEAYKAVERWVRAWEVPVVPENIDPEGAAGACITLRLRGQVVGRGTVIADDDAAVWRAARDAWLDARTAEAISDAMTDGVLDPLVAQRIAIDVQVAGALVPATGATFAQAVERCSPGYHGVAARLGARTVAMFPGEQTEREADPALAMTMLAALVELPPVELEELRSRGFTPYRFDVVQLAQPAPLTEPMFLHRGGRLVPASDAMRMESVAKFADAMADHLLTHRWPGPESHGLQGSYRMVRDEYKPAIAPPREQAFVALALSEYSTLAGADLVTAHEARSEARRIMLDLTYVTEFEEDPLADPDSAGAVLLALSRIRRNDSAAWMGEPELDALARNATQRLLRAMESEGWAKGVPPALGAMIACALASASPWDDDGSPRARAEELLRALLRGTPADQLIALMPWVVWCEQELSTAGAPIASAVALEEARAKLWEFQIAPADLEGPNDDLLGGIVLTTGPSPLPSALGARPIAGIAAMLGDARLTPAADVMDEIGRLAEALRFLMQLSVREGEAHLAASPRRAMGGIRGSLWDATISLDATSMSLIAAVETLRSSGSRLRGGADPGE